MTPNTWHIFNGKGTPHNGIERLPDPPQWRRFEAKQEERGKTYQIIQPEAVEMVNAALYLRRPLLVTGKPGTGKTSLAYAVAYELQLGQVLRWNITTRSTLQDGLYRYDAVGRLQEAKDQDNIAEIGRYIQLGALGTAFLPTQHPRVLLVDEIDKSDIDLPNDLLHIFEEGEFEIPELARIADRFPEINVQTQDNQSVVVYQGKIPCQAFPLVILTSNGEREFPPAFLRRCLRLELGEPNPDELTQIVKAHFGDEKILEQAKPIIQAFWQKRQHTNLATDQLLNAIYLVTRSASPTGEERDQLIEKLLRALSSSEGI